MLESKALVIDDLAVRYQTADKWIFKKLQLTVNKGEFVVVLGPSGCGKSTLLRLIAGFVKPSSGDILLGGQTAVSSSQQVFLPPEKRGVGFVFQSYALWPHMKIRDNVAFPLIQQKCPPDERAKRVAGILSKFGLCEYQDRYPAELSGGQRQRVALARALISQPSILLMDEPLASLDVGLRRNIQEELLEMRRQWQPTVLYVTHDQEEAIKLADRIIVMQEGEIQQSGTPEEIYEAPANLFVARFFDKVNEAVGTVEDGAQHGSILVKIGKAVVRARSNKCWPKGSRVKVVIRPSWLALQEKRADAPLPVEVIAKRFMGTYTEYILKGEEMRWVAAVPGSQARQVDTGFALEICDAFIMEGEAEAGEETT